jgi:hypothetical protein
LLPDFPRCLWVDLARRHCRQSITDEHHHVAAFAAPLLGFERQAFLRASSRSLAMNLSRLSVVERDRAASDIFGQKCPDVKIHGIFVWEIGETIGKYLNAAPLARDERLWRPLS